jgi:alginate O-acetyltransferase complex protein AlgI
MLFNSFEFLLFLPTVLVVFFLSPQNLKTSVLLVASCIFYMAFIPYYLLVLVAIIIIDYFAGILIENNHRHKNLYLTTSLFVNIAILFIFKYYNFAIKNFQAIINFLDINTTIPALEIILPIGLSFHTFQAMSYTIEVYRGNQKAEKNFLTYSLYVLYFPQLVAGPIERPQNLLHQFKKYPSLNFERYSSAFYLIIYGFFKKVIIADRFSVFSDKIFNQPDQYNGLAILFGIYSFAIQIYADFSGYSDIARGVSRLFGVELMLNFKQPYFANSIKDFWKRWHISLSTWFKDYVYIPLGGKNSRLKNALIVFGLSGIWHGANWTFLAWGLYHGLLVTLEDQVLFFKKINLNMPKFLKKLITFNLVCIGWIFFRASSLKKVTLILFQLTKDFTSSFRLDFFSVYNFGFENNEIIFCFLMLSVFLLVDFIIEKKLIRLNFKQQKLIFSTFFQYLLILFILLLGKYTAQSFIYFQF